MRGKKIDNEFLSIFIQECVASGAETPEAIVNKAKLEVSKIDKEIIEVENKKNKRSKLLGVIASFEKPDNCRKKDDAKLLSFYKISSPEICDKICELVKIRPITKSFVDENNLDMILCIKQMIDCKIISKIGDCFVRGDMFDSYIDFTLRNK